MTSTSKRQGGSFRSLRDHHLPMFGDPFHRHDRGWPHTAIEAGKAEAAKRPWRTVGIVHFREGAEAED